MDFQLDAVSKPVEGGLGRAPVAQVKDAQAFQASSVRRSRRTTACRLALSPPGKASAAGSVKP
uniref:hypothetical protein n=1 Tax=Hymenobacter sp. AT01-02 TaxID=1571877 RepID=UPI000ABACCF0